ncbi:hypothetical protein SIXOD_v1c27580 (plasmid) [Spiroplasma ixodetis Y32]|nr:hypothetical protein SIXOD_v1c27580 [Spiroplasma ixodetis Y32]
MEKRKQFKYDYMLIDKAFRDTKEDKHLQEILKRLIEK